MQAGHAGSGFTGPSSKQPVASADFDEESHEESNDVLMFDGDSADADEEYAEDQQSKLQRPLHQSRGQVKPRHRFPFGSDDNNTDTNSAFEPGRFADDNNRRDRSESDSDTSIDTSPSRRDPRQPIGIPSYGESFGGLSREHCRAMPASLAPQPRRNRHPDQDRSSPQRRHVGAGDEHSHHGGGGEHVESPRAEIRDRDFSTSDQNFSPQRYFPGDHASRHRPDYSPREDFLVHAFDSNAMKLGPYESLDGDNQHEDLEAATGYEASAYALHDAMDTRAAQPFPEVRRSRHDKETSRQQSDNSHHRSGAHTDAFPSDTFAFAGSNDYDAVGSEADITSDRVFLGKRAGRFSHSSITEMSPPMANRGDALATHPAPFSSPQSSSSYQSVFPLSQQHGHMALDMAMEQPRRKSSKKSDGRNANVTTPTAALTPSSAIQPSRWLREEDEQLREAVARFGGKNWKLIAESLGNARTDVQCLHRWNKVLKPGLVKGPWTPEEDSILSQLIARYGVGKIRWCDVAQHLPGRIGKQCRERWCNHLDSRIRKGQWTPEEDDVVFRWQQKLGNKWSEIAKLLPGRTENAVKNRFNSAARRKWMVRAASTPAAATGPFDESASGKLPGSSNMPMRYELMRRSPPPSMMPLMPTTAAPSPLSHHHHTPPELLSPSSEFLFARRDPVKTSGVGHLGGADGMLRFDMESRRAAAPTTQHLHSFQPVMAPPPLVAPATMNMVVRPPHELLRPPLPSPPMGAPVTELPIGLSLPAATFAPPPPPLLLPPPPAGFSVPSTFGIPLAPVANSMDDGVGRESIDSSAGADPEASSLAGDPPGDQQVKEERSQEHRIATEPTTAVPSSGVESAPITAMDDENMSRFLDSVALELEDMME